VFPSDENTRDFLQSHGRLEDWVPLTADEGAEYHRVFDLDLAGVVPKIACPHSPGNVKNVEDLTGLSIQQVCIGSCTNSSYRDLMIVSEILNGRAVHPDVSLSVAPGSRRILQMITYESALGILLAAGARIQECACGFCVGNGQSPRTGGVSLRTSNRNFLGRSGSRNAQVFLCSPETAAVSAIRGEVADPRDLDIRFPQLKSPRRFIIDDSMLVYPEEGSPPTKIYRGPHMGDPPSNSPLPSQLEGTVTIKLGHRITTDHIVPAGDKLKYRSNVARYADFVFEVVDDSFPERAREIKHQRRENIIVAGLGYGQGSSREHAALCPMYLGVRAVLAMSIERIHRANLINYGIVPFIFENESDYEKIGQGDELIIRDLPDTLGRTKKVRVYNRTKDYTFEVATDLQKREVGILIAGGKLPFLANEAA
jgi:aconitate hydratase